MTLGLSGDVRLGVFLAWHFRVPMTLGGERMLVPDAIGKDCAGDFPVLLADGEADPEASAAPSMTNLELARRVLWCIDCAEREIAETGVSLGVIDPPPKPEPGPRDRFASAFGGGGSGQRQAERERPDPPVIRRGAGEYQVGPDTAPLAYVRTDDNRSEEALSWFIVVAHRNERLPEWFPSRKAAIDAAIGMVKSGAISIAGEVFSWRPGAAE